MSSPADLWQIYRTRFLIKARQLDAPLVFTDPLGREHHGVPGDYLVESSDGLQRIAPREIFEDIYVPMGRAGDSRPSPLDSHFHESEFSKQEAHPDVFGSAYASDNASIVPASPAQPPSQAPARQPDQVQPQLHPHYPFHQTQQAYEPRTTQPTANRQPLNQRPAHTFVS